MNVILNGIQRAIKYVILASISRSLLVSLMELNGGLVLKVIDSLEHMTPLKSHQSSKKRLATTGNHHTAQ
eukprot:3387362-Amphidinium_carterae.1